MAWDDPLTGRKIGAVLMAVLLATVGAWLLLTGVLKTAKWTSQEAPITKLERDRKWFIVTFAVARPDGKSNTMLERLSFSSGSPLLQRSTIKVYCRPPTFVSCAAAQSIRESIFLGAMLLIFGSLILLVLRRVLKFLFERLRHRHRLAVVAHL